MKKEDSIYECPVDSKHTLKAEPRRKIICPYCRVQMNEAVKGVVNK